MPQITLTWTNGAYTPEDHEYSDQADWINRIQFRLNRTELPTRGGLYIIANPADTIVYAGQAGNFRTRFGGRTDGMENFNARSGTIADLSVIVCTVAPAAQINLAERWLVRILYERDGEQMVRSLQNINLTQPFNAPGDGLTINNSANRPAYLDARYTYRAGVQI